MNNKMYWADSVLEKIQECSLDGSSLKVLASIFGAPFGLALNQNTFFWTDRLSMAVYQTVRDAGSTTTYLSTNSTPFGLSLYNSTRTGGLS
jgi:hypothetical protein